MQMFHRKNGEEQPYWPAGPFKVRLPFVHYRWEFAEMVQALIMFVVSLAMIPLLEKYLGVPYDVALAYVVICGIGFMLPALLGVPLVPGWITPGYSCGSAVPERLRAGPRGDSGAVRAAVPGVHYLPGSGYYTPGQQTGGADSPFHERRDYHRCRYRRPDG